MYSQLESLAVEYAKALEANRLTTKRVTEARNALVDYIKDHPEYNYEDDLHY